MDITQCKKCNFILTVDEFPRATDNKLKTTCKTCTKNYQKKYYEANKKKLLQQSREYRKANKESIQRKDRERRKVLREDPKKYKKYKKKYNKWYNSKLKTDPNFKLKVYLRNRIKSALKNATAKKCDFTAKLVGCSLNKLKRHISQQFGSGMTWKNFGKWHIDHIIPLAVFDLEESSHQKVAFHYTNLQPLWAEENLKKADYVPQNFNINNYVNKKIKKI